MGIDKALEGIRWASKPSWAPTANQARLKGEQELRHVLKAREDHRSDAQKGRPYVD
jgi:hypothetical protein